jgi:hypothetical protein
LSSAGPLGQNNEFARYATEPYLNHIAQQIPGLNHTTWQTDRHTGRREAQTTRRDSQRLTLHRQAGRWRCVPRAGHHHAGDRTGRWQVCERCKLPRAQQERTAPQPPLAQLALGSEHTTTAQPSARPVIRRERAENRMDTTPRLPPR